MPKKHLIIGSGVAAFSALRRIRDKNKYNMSDDEFLKGIYEELLNDAKNKKIIDD